MSESEPNPPTNEKPSSDSSKENYEVLPSDYSKYDLSFKLIVIGESGVGKSCLTNKATKNIFDDSYNATVGFEFSTFNIKIDNTIIKLQIWDTCGQELYRSLITNFYRNSSLAIVVYAINSKESFNQIDIWLKELRMHSNPDAKVFLIGNKVDLEKDRQVTEEEGLEYSKKNNMNFFVEASALTGLNAQNIFIEAAKILYKDYLKYKDESNEEQEPKKMTLKQENQKVNSNSNKKGGCC